MTSNYKWQICRHSWWANGPASYMNYVKRKRLCETLIMSYSTSYTTLHVSDDRYSLILDKANSVSQNQNVYISRCMVEILDIIITNCIAAHSNKNPVWINSVQVSDRLVLMIPVHIESLSRDTLLLADAFVVIGLSVVKYKNRKIMSMSSEIRHDWENKCVRYIRVFIIEQSRDTKAQNTMLDYILKPWPNGDASWRLGSTCDFVWPGLACTCVDLRWRALTLVEIKFARKSTQVFHRLATQPKSTQVE